MRPYPDAPTFITRDVYCRCGIYYILNTFNNCIYVGMTKNIQARWCTHIQTLNKGKHYNKPLQVDWDTFGSWRFEFGVLLFERANISENNLRVIEKSFIKTYRSYDPIYGYNDPRVTQQNTTPGA